MSEAFEKVREALASHGAKFRETRQSHFVATCPHHEDRNPSLGVDAKDGRVLVRCYAGCHTDDIVADLGLGLGDLFDGEPDRDHAMPVRSYLYERSNGEPWFIVDRYYPKTFRQRMPGTAPGDKGGLQGREPILFHAPRVWRCMESGDCTVWLVDGEKDVEACERMGLVATCPPGHGKQWRDSYSQFLRRAKQVVIVVDQDKLKTDGTLGSGQQFAIGARAGLKAAGVKVRMVAPAVGKDATDHFAGGYGVEDFVPDTSCSVRPRGRRFSRLLEEEFAPVAFAVDRILPAGLTIFAGSPKAGKSWLVLDLCLAVAAGGPALSVLPTVRGSALYLAREDSYRRLQSRIRLLMEGSGEINNSLELVAAEEDWPGGPEGLANMTEWAEEVGNPRLVVIDTLAKVEPDMGEEGGRRGAYAGNYSMMARYKQWADLHNCAVVMVHHDRKADSTPSKDGTRVDPFTRISGTRGITGAADTLWFLETQRGTRSGELHITGRDVAEQSIELVKAGPLWMATHQPE